MKRSISIRESYELSKSFNMFVAKVMVVEIIIILVVLYTVFGLWG